MHLPIRDHAVPVCDLSQKEVGGPVCEYMHSRAIYNVLTESNSAKGWVEPPNPPQITPFGHDKIFSLSLTLYLRDIVTESQT